MKNNIRKFSPSTSWFTTVLLTVTIATFGIFAQTSASECVEASNLDQALHSAIPCEEGTHNNTQLRPTFNY